MVSAHFRLKGLNIGTKNNRRWIHICFVCDKNANVLDCDINDETMCAERKLIRRRPVAADEIIVALAFNHKGKIFRSEPCYKCCEELINQQVKWCFASCKQSNGSDTYSCVNSTNIRVIDLQKHKEKYAYFTKNSIPV